MHKKTNYKNQKLKIKEISDAEGGGGGLWAIIATNFTFTMTQNSSCNNNEAVQGGCVQFAGDRDYSVVFIKSSIIISNYSEISGISFFFTV